MMICFLLIMGTDILADAGPIDRLSMVKQWGELRKLLNLQNTTLTGKGITVGVIECRGVDFNHPVFGERRGGNHRSSGGSEHGTLVAGVISEIAPEATLISYSMQDEGDSSALLSRAFNEVQIINMSFGSRYRERGNSGYIDKMRLLREGYDKGIVMITAAGNYYGKEEGVEIYPAHSPHVITVGASNSPSFLSRLFGGKEGMTDFTSHGPTEDMVIKPDLVAPGQDIISLYPPDGYEYSSGTSISAPIITGSVALLKEAHPDWSVEEITSAICNYAAPLEKGYFKETYSPNVQGSGRLNFDSAVKSETFIFPHNVSFTADCKISECEVEKEITIKNKSARGKTYECKQGEPWIQGLQYPSSITLQPGESKKVNLKVSINERSKNLSGRLYLTCEEEQLNIPFLIDV